VSARHSGHSAVRGHVRLPSPAQRASVPSVYGAERALSSAGHADVPDADEVVPRLPDFAPTDGSEARETGRVPMDAEPRERSGRGADGVGGDALSHSGVAGDSSFSSASRDEQSSAGTAGTFEHASSRPPVPPSHTRPASMPTGSSPPGVYRYCLRAHRLRAFFLLPPGSSPPGVLF